MAGVYDAATPLLLRAGPDPSSAVRFQLLWAVQRLVTGTCMLDHSILPEPGLEFLFLSSRPHCATVHVPSLSPLGQ